MLHKSTKLPDSVNVCGLGSIYDQSQTICIRIISIYSNNYWGQAPYKWYSIVRIVCTYCVYLYVRYDCHIPYLRVF